MTMTEDADSRYNVEIQHQRPGWVTEESNVPLLIAVNRAMYLKKYAESGAVHGDIITGIRITQVNVIAEWEVRQ